MVLNSSHDRFNNHSRGYVINLNQSKINLMHDTTIVIESIDEWITFDIADTLND
jgi:hypothetical protein